MGKAPNTYYFAKYPIRRILANQLITQGNDELAVLSRLQMLVWRNTPGMRGNGCVYTDAGQKADKEWVFSTLARLGGMDRSSLRRCLNQLKVADEVEFDSRGRPCLKHWRRDRDREPNEAAERKKHLRDRDLIPEVVELLPRFLRSGEARTIVSLCGWLGYKLGRDANSTVRRAVDVMVDDGSLDVGEGGVFSVCSSVLPSTPSASRPPPSKVAEEQKTKALDLSRTCPTDIDIETIANRDFSEIPIEPIDDAPPPRELGAGTASAEEGGGRDAEGALRADSSGPPVGRDPDSGVGAARSGSGPGSGEALREAEDRAQGINSKKKRPRSSGRNFGYSRAWSGKHYAGWVPGTHPHPRRSLVELREFAGSGIWDCDLIDGMLFVAPDGFPKSARFPGGQESVFKGLLQRINKAAGGVGAADDPVRRVLRDFIEDVENQEKPFDQDAAILKTKLEDLLSDLRKG
jgi:hypothetical protein